MWTLGGKKKVVEEPPVVKIEAKVESKVEEVRVATLEPTVRETKIVEEAVVVKVDEVKVESEAKPVRESGIPPVYLPGNFEKEIKGWLKRLGERLGL